MDDSAPPLLLFVVGPPAWQDPVGQAITERTGLRLFHNHISIELALRYFDYGTPPFRHLNGEIRRRVIEEGRSQRPARPGLYLAWAFDVPEDQAFVDACAMPFRERRARVRSVELEASQAERLKRNRCLSRLAEKPSARPQASRRRRKKPTLGTSSTPAGSSTSAQTTCVSTTRS